MARQDLALALGVLAALWGVASSTPGPDVLVKPALAREARSAIEALAPETSHSSSLNGVEAVQLFGRARKALGRTQLAFLDSHADAKSADLGGWDDGGDDESVTVSQALDLVRASAASGHREGVALYGRALLLGVAVPDVAADASSPRPELERSWGLRLLTVAADHGSPLAQSYLGLLYGAGLEPLAAPEQEAGRADSDSAEGGEEGKGANRDPFSVSQSILYLYMAATGGDTLAQLALGWRHALGIGVPKSCQAAVLYYDTPAFLIVDKTREPGSSLRHSYGAPSKDRLSSSDALKSVRWQKFDDETFVGRFKSAYNRVTASSAPSSAASSGERHQTDMLQYYEYRASAGHAAAQTAMGEVYLSGSQGIPQDFERAAEYFELAHSAGDRESTSQLGHMYANGLGVEQSNETAMEFFQEAADLGSAHGMYGLGYLYLSGFTGDGGGGDGGDGGGDVPSINVDKAIHYLTKAADRGHVEAIFLLGVMYLNGWNANSKRIIAKVRDVIHDKTNVALSKESDTQKAYNYLQVAAYAGHPIAMYNTAMMRLLGMGTQASCSGALELLKPLAERLSPEARLLEHAYASVATSVDSAALAYVVGAYSGFEVAQTNAAYLLQHGARIKFEEVGFSDGTRIVSKAIDSQRQAIKFHKYAAEQGNMASLLAIGDIYFYGYGVPADRERAGEAYRRAAEIATVKKADTHASTLAGGRPKGGGEGGDFELTPPVATAFAYFNLGVMHQMGIGLPQDLHLAKRFYDLAMGSHSTASGPCTIALFSLRAHRALEDLLPALKRAADFFLELDSIPDFAAEFKKAFPRFADTDDTVLILSIVLPPLLLVMLMRRAL